MPPLRARLREPTLAAGDVDTTVSRRFSHSAGPVQLPGIWNPSKGQPVLQPVRTSKVGRTIAIIAIAVVVLVALGVVFFIATKEATDAFGSRAIDPLEQPVPSIDKDKDKDKDGPSRQEALEVDGSRALFRLMNRKGAMCTGYNQVIATTTVDAASCFAGTEAWTIQVFFDDISYDAVVANYRASDTIDVAYGGNWTVLVQTEKSARKIARATGGDWS